MEEKACFLSVTPTCDFLLVMNAFLGVTCPCLGFTPLPGRDKPVWHSNAPAQCNLEVPIPRNPPLSLLRCPLPHRNHVFHHIGIHVCAQHEQQHHQVY